ncbi:MAG TPA: 23S rRNA (cytosine(1962)-C(5))-methyltransferase RlmI, partial [Gammaproteobacteria bacterium]|nr:23S rRNA (cytosine(1962)-C(5))-methyltransferase RlmI [Gammaproteobacteria bacterium]
MSTVPRLILKNGREKSLLRKHPWIFSGAIERVVGEPGVGETLDVVDSAGQFLARAAYSPSSQIRARVWTFASEEAVDSGFFRRRLERALDSRRRLGLLGAGGACRLVFAESDGLPGLIVDRYADYVVCQFLSAGADRARDLVSDALMELCEPRGVFERSEASVRRKEGLAS